MLNYHKFYCMTILNDAQTYIGVLATFVVLCLFSIRRKNREDTESKNTSEGSERIDDSNFIYSLIRQVGTDSVQILKKRNIDLRKPYEAYYDKKGIVINKTNSKRKKKSKCCG